VPETKIDVKKGTKELLSNKSYLFCVISFNFLYGIYTSLGAVVAELTHPYGYEPSDNSIFGATFILSGVIGSFVYGVLLDKYNRYKLTMSVICFSAIFSFGLAFWTLPSRNVGLFAVNLVLVGISVLPIIPVAFAFSVELTFPLAEALSNGMMIMVSQIFGTILGLIATVLAKRNPLHCLAMYMVSTAIAAIASLFVKGK